MQAENSEQMDSSVPATTTETTQPQQADAKESNKTQQTDVVQDNSNGAPVTREEFTKLCQDMASMKSMLEGLCAKQQVAQINSEGNCKTKIDNIENKGEIEMNEYCDSQVCKCKTNQVENPTSLLHCPYKNGAMGAAYAASLFNKYRNPARGYGIFGHGKTITETQMLAVVENTLNLCSQGRVEDVKQCMESTDFGTIAASIAKSVSEPTVIEKPMKKSKETKKTIFVRGDSSLNISQLCTKYNQVNWTDQPITNGILLTVVRNDNGIEWEQLQKQEDWTQLNVLASTFV